MLLSSTLPGRREKRREHLEEAGTLEITFPSRRRTRSLKLNVVQGWFVRRMKMRLMRTGWTSQSSKQTRRMSTIVKQPRVTLTVNQRHGRKCK